MTDLLFNRLNQRKLFFVPTYDELTFPTIYFGKQVEFPQMLVYAVLLYTCSFMTSASICPTTFSNIINVDNEILPPVPFSTLWMVVSLMPDYSETSF